MEPLRIFQQSFPDIEGGTALGEIKAYLRIEGDWADREIYGFLNRAVVKLQHNTRRQILTSTMRLSVDCFPKGDMLIPRAPLQSVESIEYTDADDAQQTLDSATYTVITDTEPGRVRLNKGETWPAGARDIVVNYTAGYGPDWADLPGMIQDCLLHMVSESYWNRSSELEKGQIDVYYEMLRYGDDFL